MNGGNKDNGSKSLSGGAIVGIVIGVVVLLAVVGGVWFFRHSTTTGEGFCEGRLHG